MDYKEVRQELLKQYVSIDPAKFKDLTAANEEISKQSIVIHDLMYQVQELTRVNANIHQARLIRALLEQDRKDAEQRIVALMDN